MTRGDVVRAARSEDGQSLVEFVLMFPFVMILVFFIVEFGFVFHMYLIVNNAAAEATRYASVGNLPGSCNTNPVTPSVEGRAVNVSSNTLTCAEVTVRYAKNTPDTGFVRGDEVTVKISHTYQMISPLGPLMAAFSFGTIPTTITMSSCSEARLEARPSNQALLVAGAECN